MSFFDSLFGGSSNNDVGRKLLMAYYQEAKNYPAFNYPSFEAWSAYLISRVPDFVTFIGELVNMNYASTTVGDAESRLVQLANSSGGEATIPQITKAVGGTGDTINWGAAVEEVSVETIADAAEQLSEVAQNVGTGVLSTVKLVKYLPFILLAAGGIYIFTIAKSHGKLLGK